MFFTYTDGIPEAVDESERACAMNRLIDRLNASKQAPMREVLPIVRQDLCTFAGNAEQFEDITHVGICLLRQQREEHHEGNEF